MIETQYSINIKPIDSLLVIIDNEWDLSDLVEFMESIESIYNYSEIVQVINRAQEYSKTTYVKKENEVYSSEYFWELLNLHTSTFKWRKIKIASIKYGSEGWIQLLFGAASITAIVSLIKHYIPNQKTRIELWELKEQLLERKIKNLKDLGFSREEIRDLLFDSTNRFAVGIQKMKRLFESGKVKELKSHKDDS